MFVDLYNRFNDEDYFIGALRCDKVSTVRSYIVDGKIVKKVEISLRDNVTSILFVKAIFRITYGNYKLVLADRAF